MKGWYGNKRQHSLASRGIKTSENEHIHIDYRAKFGNMPNSIRIKTDDPTLSHLIGYLESSVFTEMYNDGGWDEDLLLALMEHQDAIYSTEHQEEVEIMLGRKLGISGSIEFYSDDPTLIHLLGYISADKYADMIYNYNYDEGTIWILLETQERAYGGNIQDSVTEKYNELKQHDR